MRTRRLGLVVVVALVVGGAVAWAKKAPLTATTFSGTYVGTWKNTTFGSGGPFQIRISSPDGSAIVVDGSGNDFGCGAKTPDVVTLVQGVDWTPTGFTYHGTAQGNATVVYKHNSGKLTGTATDTCRGSWKLKGKLTPTKFKGKMTTTFPDGKKAHSKASATKQA